MSRKGYHPGRALTLMCPMGAALLCASPCLFLALSSSKSVSASRYRMDAAGSDPQLRVDFDNLRKMDAVLEGVKE